MSQWFCDWNTHKCHWFIEMWMSSMNIHVYFYFICIFSPSLEFVMMSLWLLHLLLVRPTQLPWFILYQKIDWFWNWMVTIKWKIWSCSNIFQWVLISNSSWFRSVADVLGRQLNELHCQCWGFDGPSNLSHKDDNESHLDKRSNFFMDTSNNRESFKFLRICGFLLT